MEESKHGSGEVKQACDRVLYIVTGAFGLMADGKRALGLLVPGLTPSG